MVRNPPCDAGDIGSIPGPGTKIPHAVEQLSPCTTTGEFMCCNERFPRATSKTKCSQIKNTYILFFRKRKQQRFCIPINRCVE